MLDLYSFVVVSQELLSALFRLPDKFDGALNSDYEISRRSIKTRAERPERREESTSAHGPTERRSSREHTSIRIKYEYTHDIVNPVLITLDDLFRRLDVGHLNHKHAPDELAIRLLHAWQDAFRRKHETTGH
jgi:hypothetical protein